LLYCVTMLFVPANSLALSYNWCSHVNCLSPTSLDSESLHYAAWQKCDAVPKYILYKSWTVTCTVHTVKFLFISTVGTLD
jgi:hypothetical protein